MGGIFKCIKTGSLGRYSLPPSRRPSFAVSEKFVQTLMSPKGVEGRDLKRVHDETEQPPYLSENTR